MIILHALGLFLYGGWWSAHERQRKVTGSTGTSALYFLCRFPAISGWRLVRVFSGCFCPLHRSVWPPCVFFFQLLMSIPLSHSPPSSLSYLKSPSLSLTLFPSIFSHLKSSSLFSLSATHFIFSHLKSIPYSHFGSPSISLKQAVISTSLASRNRCNAFHMTEVGG